VKEKETDYPILNHFKRKKKGKTEKKWNKKNFNHCSNKKNNHFNRRKKKKKEKNTYWG